MRLFYRTNDPFMAWRRRAFAVSGAVILVGLAALALRGGPRYGVDFTGGSLIQLRFQEPIDIPAARAKVATVGIQGYELQRFGEPNEIIIRTGELLVEEARTRQVREALQASFAGMPFEVLRIETVGAKVGKELAKKAILAVVYGMLGILVYVGWRYEWRFAVAADVALVHDVLVALGLFALLGKEITLPVVAAFLTLVGFSVNDTIVIFDRIREGLHLHRREPREKVFNDSINQTLSRTVITTGTALFSVIALFLFGGPVIHDFAFVLLVGFISGTYSTIFVAAPLIIEWGQRVPEKKAAI